MDWKEKYKSECGLLTTAQVAEILNVSMVTVWRWGKSGYLVPVRVGGYNRYRVEDVENIIRGA